MSYYSIFTAIALALFCGTGLGYYLGHWAASLSRDDLVAHAYDFGYAKGHTDANLALKASL